MTFCRQAADVEFSTGVVLTRVESCAKMKIGKIIDRTRGGRAFYKNMTKDNKRRAIGDEILTYENGEMSDEEVISFFQRLIDTGQVWHLQGSYGRTATQLIEDGLCTLGKKGHHDAYSNYVPSKYEVEKGTKGSEEYCKKVQKERRK